MKILAIDPGTIESGWIVLEDGKIAEFGKDLNNAVKQSIRTLSPDIVIVEHVQSFGMTVGKKSLRLAILSASFVKQLLEIPAPIG